MSARGVPFQSVGESRFPRRQLSERILEPATNRASRDGQINGLWERETQFTQLYDELFYETDDQSVFRNVEGGRTTSDVEVLRDRLVATGRLFGATVGTAADSRLGLDRNSSRTGCSRQRCLPAARMAWAAVPAAKECLVSVIEYFGPAIASGCAAVGIHRCSDRNTGRRSRSRTLSYLVTRALTSIRDERMPRLRRDDAAQF